MCKNKLFQPKTTINFPCCTFVLERFFLDNGTKNSFGNGNTPSNWDEKEDQNMMSL
jgi:hypothetical protein